ncbi:type ISP restriction/modification enzyme [Coleofasciculus sp. F4-SAH-05]|uniref:type ISP restriction/modification enzyme n=1 Tax=Coleofasciculus sp. F4-SAH-05 TaxID=3069525 RepID=UPI0033009A70
MTKIYHADLWGSREDKYRYLQEHDVTTVEWTEIFPQSPFYLFCPQNTDLLTEYNSGWKITKIMPVHVYGFKSHRDHYAIDFDANALKHRIDELVKISILDDPIYSSKHHLGSWDYKSASQELSKQKDYLEDLDLCAYRPFDNRPMFYSSLIMDRIRPALKRHLFKKNNFCLVCSRQISNLEYNHFFVSDLVPNDCLISNITKESNHNFPLYLYPDTTNQQGNLFVEKSPNLSSDFIAAIREKLGYIPTPEAIFYYIYAIFHSPTYRQRYAEFLKIDFPRVPLTSNDKLFKDLGAKGQELVDLHLMKSNKLNNLITKIGGDGDNAVTEVTYKPKEQRVYINKTRYFEGIAPDVWEFKIGGYQVLSKWLKDRKKAKRTLSFDELLHYQKVVVAIKETMELMEEIDQLIPSFPIE